MRKQEAEKIKALFAGAVQIKRTPKMQQLETSIEREAAKRGRYDRSIKRRIRHDAISQDELDTYREEKIQLAREMALVR